MSDASSGNTAPSLNDSLYSGPNMLLSKIFNVMTRFRFNMVSILTDIRLALLNVEASAAHREI